MLAYALSSNTWWAVAFLTAVSVLTMLGMMAKILRYELLLIKVVSSARNMRTKLQQSIDEVEQEKTQQAADASQALKDTNAANAEDQPEDVGQTANEGQTQDSEESNSDESPANNADSDSPDELSSNVDETESGVAPENPAAAAA